MVIETVCTGAAADELLADEPDPPLEAEDPVFLGAGVPADLAGFSSSSKKKS
jgi:hypothetical protein